MERNYTWLIVVARLVEAVVVALLGILADGTLNQGALVDSVQVLASKL